MKELNWNFIRSCLKTRRFARKMKKLGYTRHETDLEIVRGFKWGWRIVDVQIDPGGKAVWTKIAP